MKNAEEAYQERQPFTQSDFPVDVFINDSDPMQVESHWHNSIEILFVLQGKTKIIVNDDFFAVTKNDLIIINESTVHGTEPCSDINTEIIVIQFMPQLIETNLFNIFECKYIIPFLKYNSQGYVFDTLNSNQDMYRIIYKIYREFKKQDPAYELYIEGAILQLISCLVRNSLVQADTNKLEQKFKKLQPVLTYLENNYHKEIDLGMASDMVNMSYYHFSRYFKKAIGHSFTEYLNLVRVLEAKKLLLTEELNISEIAYKVGYSNISSFNRAFKKINGLTPTEFKNANFAKD